MFSDPAATLSDLYYFYNTLHALILSPRAFAQPPSSNGGDLLPDDHEVPFTNGSASSVGLLTPVVSVLPP